MGQGDVGFAQFVLCEGLSVATERRNIDSISKHSRKFPFMVMWRFVAVA